MQRLLGGSPSPITQNTRTPVSDQMPSSFPDPRSPDGWAAFYALKQGAADPGVEITNLTAGDPTLEAAAWAVAAGRMVVRNGEEIVGPNVCVVLPPSRRAATETIFEHIHSLGGDPGTVDVVVAGAADLAALGDVVRGRAAPAAVCVVDADAFGAGDPMGSPADGDREAASSWVARVGSTASMISEIQREVGGIHVLLLVDRPSPDDTAFEPLLSLPDVGATFVQPVPVTLTVAGVDVSPETYHEWVRRLRVGDDTPLDEVDALDIPPLNKAHLGAHLLQAVGQSTRAFARLRPYVDELAGGHDAGTAVAVAWHAWSASELGPASDLLHAAVLTEPTDLHILEAALDLARELHDKSLIARTRDRLVALHPWSDPGIRERSDRCTSPADFQALSDDIRARSAPSEGATEYAAYVLAFSEHMAQSPSGPAEAVADLSSRWPERAAEATRAIALTLLDRGDASGAAAALRAGPNSVDHPGLARTWLDVAERILLEAVPGAGPSLEHISILEEAYRAVAAYLFRHPDDGMIRNGAYKLASPETSGRWILSILGADAVGALAAMLDRGIGSGGELGSPDAREAEAPYEAVLSAFERTLETSAAQAAEGQIQIGSGTPADPAPHTHRQILDGLWILVRGADSFDEGVESVVSTNNLLHVALLYAKVAGRPGEAAELYARTATTLTLAGQPQRARDIAEHALVMAPDDDVERAASWLAFVEIYLVARRPHEAVLGLSALAAADPLRLPPRMAYSRAVLTARVLRDLQMFDSALEALDHATRIAELAGIAHLVEERHFAIRFGSMLNLALASDGQARSELPSLVGEAIDRIHTYALSGEETLPLVMPLISALPILPEEESARVRAAARAAAEVSSGTARRYLSAVVDPPTTVEELKAFVAGSTETRHAEDAASDLALATLLARLALDRGDLSAEERLGLLDWLANHAVRPPDVPARTAPDGLRVARDLLARQIAQDPPGSPEARAELARLTEAIAARGPLDRPLGPRSTPEVLEAAAAMNARGVAVVAYARRNGGSGPLSTVTVAGAAPVASDLPMETYNPQAFFAWRRTYPYGYTDVGRAGTGVNVFEQSLVGQGLPVPDGAGPILFVPEADLQLLPPNLPLVEGEVRGDTQPRMVGALRPVAAAPSLAWIHGSQSAPPTPSGRRQAWVPVPTNADGVGGFMPGPLEHVARQIEALGAIPLSTTAEPPAELVGADLAVVGIHGSIDASGQRFHRVGDESDHYLTPGKLADHVRDALAVVLFVCSAGRLDAHPFSPAALGLPSALLGNGCRAVVASPWPLDVAVVGMWLPPFVAAWDGGATIVEAVFEANKAVRRDSPGAPDRFLAMNLYGDPTLRI